MKLRACFPRSRRRRDDDDLLLPALRCPLCRGQRRAVQGRAGPYFHCRCLDATRPVPVPAPAPAVRELAGSSA